MLVNCPECSSPVFVRSAAIEQRKPQRCYACKAQLLVDGDGQVEIAVSGKLAAAPPGDEHSPTVASSFDPDATRVVQPSDDELARLRELSERPTPKRAEPARAAPPPSPPAPAAPAAVSGAALPVVAPPSAIADATRPLSRDPNAYAATGPRPVTMAGVSLAELERREHERLAALERQRAVERQPAVDWAKEAERQRALASAAEVTQLEGPAPVSLEGMRPLTTPPPASLPDLPLAELPRAADDDVTQAAAPSPRGAETEPTTPPLAGGPDDDLPFGDATELGEQGGLSWEPSFEPIPGRSAGPAAEPWFSDGTLVQEVPADLLRAAAFRTGDHDTSALAQPASEPTARAETGAFDVEVADREELPEVTQAEAQPRFADRPLEELFDRSGAQLTPPSLDDLPAASAAEPITPEPSAPEPSAPEPSAPEPSALEPSAPEEEPPLVAGALIDAPAEELLPELAPLDDAPRAFANAAPEHSGSRPLVFVSEDEEPYTLNAPERRGGVIGFAAALVVGAGVGLAAAYTYPAAPAPTPLEQKLSDASALIGTGDPAAAIPLLEQVLAEAPDHDVAVRRLAIATSLTGDTDAAERHYLRYLRLARDQDDKRAVRELLGLDEAAPDDAPAEEVKADETKPDTAPSP